jgi:hypothetical protein
MLTFLSICGKVNMAPLSLSTGPRGSPKARAYPLVALCPPLTADVVRAVNPVVGLPVKGTTGVRFSPLEKDYLAPIFPAARRDN